MKKWSDFDDLGSKREKIDYRIFENRSGKIRDLDQKMERKRAEFCKDGAEKSGISTKLERKRAEFDFLKTHGTLYIYPKNILFTL